MQIRSIAMMLEDVSAGLTQPETSMGELLDALHERGIAMILLIFALPMALPVPVPPGINIMLASPLVFLTAQQALGAHAIWLPEKLKKKTLKSDSLKSMITKTIPYMKKTELLIRPRAAFLTQDGPSRLFGLMGLIMALTVCIPVPLTNTIPSFGIALMSAGFIMRDGLAVLAGALIGICWVTLLAVSVVIFGPEAFEIIKNTIKSFL
jgi:hypothetical protein